MPDAAKRVRSVDEPIIHVVKGEADRLRRAGARLLDLGQATPYYRPPQSFMDEVTTLLQSRDHANYTPDPGLPEAREAVARRLAGRHGLPVAADSLILTCGANQAYVNAALALFDPGDEVLLPAPFYFNHEMALRMIGVVPVPVYSLRSARPDAPRLDSGTSGVGWAAHRITAAALEAKRTPRTRGITLVTPGNPLGTAYTAGELAEVARFAARHDLWIISDETYMDLLFDGRPHASALAAPDARDRTVLISSFSKSLALPGWRIGFLAAPATLIPELMKVQDTIAICAPHPAQLAVMAGLPGIDKFLVQPLAELARRRDILARFVTDRGLRWIPPDGTLFALVDFGAPDSAAFCLDLLRGAGVVTVPASAFGTCAEGWVRLSFGSTPRQAFVYALEAIGAFLDRRSGPHPGALA